MEICLTNNRKANIMDLSTTIQGLKQPSIRQVSQLLGAITSSFPGVDCGPLHYRLLESDKIKALKIAKGNFDKPMTISSAANEEIQWWVDNLLFAKNFITHGNPTMIVTTGASNTGWGAVFNGKRVSGICNETEIKLHINLLELKAVYFALSTLFKTVRNKHIKVLSDNTTTVCSINKMGSIHSPNCNAITKCIWEWAISRNIWLTASHLPGVLNKEADFESRKNDVRTEWKLSTLHFTEIVKYFRFEPEIEIFFASRANTQLEKYISYHPDPGSIAVNSFSVSWHVPPFSCVGRMLSKIITDKAHGIIVVPNWPNQAWFSVLHNICECDPYLIPPSKQQLHLPNQPEARHQLHKKLELLACLVHG